MNHSASIIKGAVEGEGGRSMLVSSLDKELTWNVNRWQYEGRGVVVRVNEDPERPREGCIGAEVSDKRSAATVTRGGSSENEEGIQ